MTECLAVYIAVGANADHPLQQVNMAVRDIGDLSSMRVVKCSSWYLSHPMGGPSDQPMFVNGVVMVETKLEPLVLLNQLQRLERKQGRDRSQVMRWGPRVIDLDILLYGSDVMKSDHLTVPHPRLFEREFVLYPLAEIAPELVLPTGEGVLALKAACPPRGIMVLHKEISL